MDESGNFSLLLPSDDLDYKVAQFLIKKGADVNSTNSDGVTPLMKACEKSYGTEAIATTDLTPSHMASTG